MNFEGELERLRREGNLRVIPADSAGADVLDLTTNDYLGLACNRTMRGEFMRGAMENDYLLSASASRLLASEQRSFGRLEEFLKGLYGRETLLFNSGYHANTGMLGALTDKRTLVVADKLVHASIIDGIKLGGGVMKRFRHNDMRHLRSIAEAERWKWDRMVFVTESVFSMDGDRAPLGEIIEIKRGVGNALLYVDEAHAVGVEGPGGLGLTQSLEPSLRREVDVVVGTLGKALCSSGAYVVADKTIRNFAVNKARSLVFSTALPPLCCEWTRFVMERTVGMDKEREHLKKLGGLVSAGLKRRLGVEVAESHIIPIIMGSAERAVAVSKKLLERGIKVLPIRTPTVPPGTERLRVSLSAGLSEDVAERFVKALEEVL